VRWEYPCTLTCPFLLSVRTISVGAHTPKGRRNSTLSVSEQVSAQGHTALHMLQNILKFHCSMYSKTSNNGPSEKRTTSLQRTAHLPPIDFTIELIHYKPPRSRHLSTPNNGHWTGPDLPSPIQNYLWKWTVKRYTHIMFRNATIAGFNDRALYYHCASLSRQRKATERSENASPADHTLSRLPEVYRMQAIYNGYLRIPDTKRRGGPCHCSRKWNISVTNNIRVFI